MARPTMSRYYTYIKPVIENKVLRSALPYIFSLATITILVVFAIRPTITTISNLQKTLVENQKILADLKKKEGDLTLARQNLEALGQETRVKINTLIPKDPSVTTLIASLQNASSQNASISALQVQPVTVIDKTIPDDLAKLGTGEVTFSLNSQGSFAGLLNILQNFNKTPRLIKIDSVGLSKKGDGPTTLSINGKTYFLKQAGK